MAKKKYQFSCPKDGIISSDEVAFLCNNCKQEELLEKDGIFICPGCLENGENFQCMICDSKEVKVIVRKKEKTHF